MSLSSADHAPSSRDAKHNVPLRVAACPSPLEAEEGGVAEVAEGEAVEEAEAGEAVAAGRDRQDAHDVHVFVERQRRDPDSQLEGRESARIRSAQRDRLALQASTEPTNALTEDQLELRIGRPAAGVREQ